MSFAKMNTFVQLVQIQNIKDNEGFSTDKDEVIAEFRAYFEPKHGSEKWVNRAELFSATALFQFRKIPNTTIATDMVLVCDYGRFEITSIEDVKGKGMYIEVMAKVVD